MEQNVFLQGYFEIIEYLYQIKNTLNILIALFKFIRRNLMEFQRTVLKITSIHIGGIGTIWREKMKHLKHKNCLILIKYLNQFMI